MLKWLLSMAILLLFFLSAPTGAQQPSQQETPKLPPTSADYAYGQDSERQKLDFWQAESKRPAPVVVFIHGGGWKTGDKRDCPADDVQRYMDNGVSVAAINYRFIDQAMEQHVEPPVQASLHDAARALQTLRANAKPWNIDPQRIGATGRSAGACTSLWLALHDDLADPNSSDPVARESTRLSCAAVVAAQTSLDPQELREWIPNAVYGGHAFGFAAPNRTREQEFELLIPDRERVLPWIREFSPIEHVSQDDPPIFMDYPEQTTPPVVGQTEDDPTHSALYGVKLAERLAAAGVEAVVTYPGHQDGQYGSVKEFLIAKLTEK